MEKKGTKRERARLDLFRMHLSSPFVFFSFLPASSFSAFEHEDMEEKDERMYSAYEVKVMVEKAVESREKTLREEYDRILQGLLQEQYNNFVKFNEDHISRRLRNSDFSYIS